MNDDLEPRTDYAPCAHVTRIPLDFYGATGTSELCAICHASNRTLADFYVTYPTVDRCVTVCYQHVGSAILFLEMQSAIEGS